MVSFVASIPRSAWGDIRRLVTLAWAVVGLCLSKVVNLSSWGESVEGKATYAASRARRFQRWLDNAKSMCQAFTRLWSKLR